MRSGDGHRPGRLIRSDIVQICLGLALAAFLVQADRTLSPREADAGLSHAMLNKHTIETGFHMARLEVDYLVAVVSRAVGATKDGKK